ncbi:MAG: hypothetical protein JSV30_00160 [Candidatus Omnitrophota bacterium]|nr:MAG: hypothetical protein JSV30_00160 [Candidatus Omnitrophota bacterium]
MGKVLLETDLKLKKDAARFTDPRTPIGQRYWAKLRQNLTENGISNLKTLPLSRLWIVPNEAILQERGTDRVNIISASLKVCLEAEYLEQHNAGLLLTSTQSPQEKLLQNCAISAMKEVIVPVIEHDVNYSKRYAPIREVYYSLILAEYFKQKYWGKGTMYDYHINQGRLSGLHSRTPWNKRDFFDSYVKSYKEGEYSFYQQEYDPYQFDMAKKHYFSGGILAGTKFKKVETISSPANTAADPFGKQWYAKIITDETGIGLEGMQLSPVSSLASHEEITLAYSRFAVNPERFNYDSVEELENLSSPVKDQSFVQKKKIVYFVLDGVSDGEYGIKEFGGKTPLEYANLPNLTRLVQQGAMGQMDPIKPGFAPESDPSVMAMLNYDPDIDYPGRGIIEALGIDADVQEGDAVFRLNFGTGHKEGELLKIEDPRAQKDLTQEEAEEIAAEINNNLELTSYSNAKAYVYATKEYRGVIIIRIPTVKFNTLEDVDVTNASPRYKKISKNASESLPEGSFKYEVQKVKPRLDPTEKTQLLSKLVNEAVEKIFTIMDNSEINKKRRATGRVPVNLILLRGPSVKDVFLKSLSEKTGGMNWTMVQQMPVERGIGLLAGMNLVQMPRYVADLPREYKETAQIVEDQLKKSDGLYVHLKGPDPFGHKGDAQGKVNVTQLIDEHFFGPLLKSKALDDVVVVITADHTTATATMSHSGDPVPVLIIDDIEPDITTIFTEKEAKKGSLGRFKAKELLPKLMELAGRDKEKGLAPSSPIIPQQANTSSPMTRQVPENVGGIDLNRIRLKVIFYEE